MPKTRTPATQIDLLERLSELLRDHGARAVIEALADSADCLIDATDEPRQNMRRNMGRAAELRDLGGDIARIERKGLTLGMAAGVLADNGCELLDAAEGA